MLVTNGRCSVKQFQSLFFEKNNIRDSYFTFNASKHLQNVKQWNKVSKEPSYMHMWCNQQEMREYYEHKPPIYCQN